MPRDTRTRRLTRPASEPARRRRRRRPGRRSSRCWRTRTRLTDLLPHLHQHALDVDRRRAARCCFEHNPRNGVAAGDVGLRRSTRCAPIRGLPATGRSGDAWRDAFDARRADARRRRRAPDAGSRGAARHARRRCCCRSCAADERVGLLAVGFDAPPAAVGRRRRRVEVGRRVPHRARAVPPAPERRAAARPPRAARRVLREPVGDAEPGGGPRHLLPRRQPAVRRRSHVGLDSRPPRAPSRAAGVVRSRARRARRPRQRATIRSRRPRSPCARARAEIVSPADDEATATVTVPLRGCRRALGTIVFEGVRVETGGELDLLDRADELGRQLSSAIENMQLLDDVMRSRRELENTFDSIAHLVVVVRLARPHRPRQRGVREPRRPAARRAARSAARRLRRPGARARGSQRHDRRRRPAGRRRGGTLRGRRSGAERTVHGHGHRSARTTSASASAACSSRAT